MTPVSQNFRADFRCSTAARERGDAPVGTAPPARVWFLIEQASGWGTTAWEGLAVEPAVKSTLTSLVDQAGARMMLIRQPGKRSKDLPRRWCIVNQDAEVRVRWGTATSGHDLVDAASTLARRDLGEAADTNADPLILVCTHGRHDVCCAVRGRPVAARAAELWPQSTWECTHTGGDRFAANLTLLPDGACYGRLDPGDVESLVRDHLAGAVHADALRGPTGWPSFVQAAVVGAHRRYGPLSWGDVAVVSQHASPQRWQVRLKLAGRGQVEVEGHMETSEPHQLTCAAAAPKVMHLPVIDRWVVGDSQI